MIRGVMSTLMNELPVSAALPGPDAAARSSHGRPLLLALVTTGALVIVGLMVVAGIPIFGAGPMTGTCGGG